MKGFVISMDAVIGLIISFSLLIAVNGFFAESTFNSFNGAKLNAVSEDILSVLEKSGKLENAVKENKNNEIAKYLNKTSKNLCFEINIYKYESMELISSATKKACKKKEAELIISTKRSFIEKQEIYWAEMKSWHAVKK